MIGQRILREILGRKQNLQGFPHAQWRSACLALMQGTENLDLSC